ncbi:MAG TPA: hypothetical protein VF192_04950 [Longimicrobiales bacterium]
MERHERQDRTHARAVCAGIAVSAAVHAAAFALIRFSVPALDEAREDRVADASEAVPAVTEPVMRVLALREAPAAGAAALSSAVAVRVDAPAAPAPEAVLAPAAAPAMAEAAEVPEAALAAAEIIEVSPAALSRIEPEAAPGGAVLAGEPADAAAQTAAVQPEPAMDEDEEPEYDLPPGVPLYQPGSVGRAKGKWGGAVARGGADGERPRGAVVIGGGRDGRHCPPLPGRGRIPPTLRPPTPNRTGHPAGV